MKLMIVDDEKIIRESIAENILINTTEIDDIITADNGLDAFEKFKNFVPDILLTDIRMPQKDGIELAYDILKINPDCKIIFISAYSEKEYLKAAIDLKVEGFIEKPFEVDVVVEYIKNVCLNIVKLDTMKNALQKDLDNKLIKLIMRKPNDEIYVKLDEIAKEIKLNLSTDLAYNFVIVQFFNNSDGDLIEKKSIVIEFLKSHYRCSIFEKDEKMIMALIISKKSLVNVDSITIAFRKFLLNERLDINVYLGITVNDIGNAYESFYSVACLLQQGFVIEKNQILVADGFQDINLVSLDKFVEKFELYIENQDEENCSKNMIAFEQFVIEKKQAMMISHIRQACAKMFFLLEKACYKNNVIDYDGYFTLEKIFEFEKFEDIIRFLTKMIRYYFENLNKNYSSLTNNIIKFIDENYQNEELNLKAISDDTGYSIQHMCNVFKNDMNTTINNYILAVRVNRAKQFILETDLSLEQISQMIGFVDVGYFSKVFKKVVGEPPKKFKNRSVK